MKQLLFDIISFLLAIFVCTVTRIVVDSVNHKNDHSISCWDVRLPLYWMVAYDPYHYNS